MFGSFSETPVWLAQWILIPLGMIWGSFFNVLIYRVPRNLPIAWPPSSCPVCGSRIRPWHNIPVLGWVLLKGRCRDCRSLISMQYPVVEALCGFLAWMACWLVHPSAESMVNWNDTLAMFWLLITLVPIFAVDFPYQLIPDTVTLGGIVVGVVLWWIPGGVSWQEGLLGIAIAGGGLWIFGWGMGRWLHKDAMGFGDVKLLAGFGAIMGWSHALGALIGAAFLALCVMIPWRWLRRQSTHEPLPFGPFIGLMGPVFFLWGDSIFAWYFHLFHFLG